MDKRKATKFDIQDAIDDTGFGRFNFKIIIVGYFLYANAAYSSNSIGLVFPSVACVFKMTMIDEIRLNASFVLGMMCGTYIWGCVAEVKGRRGAVLAAVLLHALSEILSAIVPNYWAFLFFKFLSGLAITGQSTLVYSYLSDFHPIRYREKVLCWLEIPWTIGSIALPFVGWAVLPLTFKYHFSNFHFQSWNLFIVLCALPSLLIAIAVFLLPESPKYLMGDEQELEAFQVLARMYSENTGDPSETYLEMCKKRKSIDSSPKLSNDKITQETKSHNLKKSLKKVRKFYVQTVTILKPPYLRNVAVTCTVMFSMTSSFYMMMHWFPERFQRIAEFEELYPEDSIKICVGSDPARLVNGSQPILRDDHHFYCEHELQTNAYVHNLLVGLACIPVSIWFPLYVSRLGYRFFLVFITMASSAMMVGLFFATSPTQNLILSCILQAHPSLSVTIVYCAIVEIFPANLRVTVIALSAFSGRFGGFIGNLIFHYLLDIQCMVLIIVVAIMLFLSGILCFFIPQREKEKMIVNP